MWLAHFKVILGGEIYFMVAGELRFWDLFFLFLICEHTWLRKIVLSTDRLSLYAIEIRQLAQLAYSLGLISHIWVYPNIHLSLKVTLVTHLVDMLNLNL